MSEHPALPGSPDDALPAVAGCRTGQPLRILFLNSIGKHKFGGGERWMVRAAQGLADAGHAVFVAGGTGSEFLQAAQSAGLATRSFRITGDLRPFASWRVARFLREQAIDVLVCNLIKDVRVAGLAARIVGTAAVISRHGVQLSGQRKSHELTLTRLTDGILTNTRSIRDTYVGFGWFGPEFVEVIYNGIADKSHVVARDFGAEYPGKKVLLAAGRLSEQKGFTHLIEAARILRDVRDDFVLLVAGRGSLEDTLKRQVAAAGLQHTVHFPGFIADLDPWVKGCDLFVLSSLYEGMPNVLMEAMALGRAAVATDVNGVRELMEDGATGIVVAPADPRALARGVLTLLDDAVQRERMGARAIEVVCERFTVPAMVRALETYFRRKVAEGRTRR